MRLKLKVTVAPLSQRNENVFSAHLNRSVNKSTEQREDGRLPDPSSSDSETPIVECTVGMWNEERRSVRRSKRAPTRVGDELTVVSKVRWRLTEQRLMDQQRQLELYALPDRQPNGADKVLASCAHGGQCL